MEAADPLSDLQGETEQANELARWLLRIGNGATARDMEKDLHISRTLAAEYRNGSKLIRADLLHPAVTHYCSGLSVPAPAGRTRALRQELNKLLLKDALLELSQERAEALTAAQATALEEGVRLLQAAKAAKAAKAAAGKARERPAPVPVVRQRAGSDRVAELALRLDDARQMQIDALQQARVAQERVTALEMLVGQLQEHKLDSR
ncbi:hypothetical protein J7E99_38455 [Streptomyces sp. ISL-44]|nr:hypothetical protein [Streptomyces sp. ISL-44]